MPRLRPTVFSACVVLAVAGSYGCSGGAEFAIIPDSGIDGPATGDAASRDARARDTGAKDTGLKDASAKDGGAKDGGAKDGGAKDGGAKDTGSKDGGGKDAGKDDSGHDGGGSADGSSGDADMCPTASCSSATTCGPAPICKAPDCLDHCCGTTNLDAGAPCSDPSGTGTVCDGHGACVMCNQPNDCEGTPLPCTARACNDHQCGVTDDVAGTSCGSGGDICSGSGKCVQCTPSFLENCTGSTPYCGTTGTCVQCTTSPECGNALYGCVGGSCVLLGA